MLTSGPRSRVSLAVQAVDLRAGVDRLAGAVRALGLDPLYLSLSRRRQSLGAFPVNGSGSWVLCKRLELGSFGLPPIAEGDRPVVRAPRLLAAVPHGFHPMARVGDGATVHFGRFINRNSASWASAFASAPGDWPAVPTTREEALATIHSLNAGLERALRRIEGLESEIATLNKGTGGDAQPSAPPEAEAATSLPAGPAGPAAPSPVPKTGTPTAEGADPIELAFATRR